MSSLCANQMRVSTRHRSVIPQVVRWTRNQAAVIMELNNGSVQINFIRDHAKVIFWGGAGGAADSLLLTYMATDKAPMTYSLKNLPRVLTNSPSSPLLIIDQKISQSLIVLRELAQSLQSNNRWYSATDTWQNEKVAQSFFKNFSSKEMFFFFVAIVHFQNCDDFQIRKLLKKKWKNHIDSLYTPWPVKKAIKAALKNLFLPLWSQNSAKHPYVKTNNFQIQLNSFRQKNSSCSYVFRCKWLNKNLFAQNCNIWMAFSICFSTLMLSRSM